MTPGKIQKRNQVMLEELTRFYRKHGRLPSIVECRDKKNFHYAHATYWRVFGSVYDAAILCGIENPAAPKRVCKNPKTLANQIRRLLRENPNAGYEEIEAACGKITRSVAVTYYAVYKEMYHKSGKLHKNGKHDYPNSNRARVRNYFKEHPEHSILDAMKVLFLTWSQVYNALYSLAASGQPATYRQLTNEERGHGKALQIRKYMAEHPAASCKECATAIGVSSQYVNSIVYMARIQGKLPKKSVS